MALFKILGAILAPLTITLRLKAKLLAFLIFITPAAANAGKCEANYLNPNILPADLSLTALGVPNNGVQSIDLSESNAHPMLLYFSNTWVNYGGSDELEGLKNTPDWVEVVYVASGIRDSVAPRNLPEFLESKVGENSWQHYWDKNGFLLQKLGYMGLPVLAFVDVNGNVIGKYPGGLSKLYKYGSERTLAEDLSQLFCDQ